MNEARPPLAGVTMTTLKEKDVGSGSGVGGGGKAAGSKRTPTIRIEVKLEAKKRNGENYEFCYPDLFKTAVKNLKLTEASKTGEEVPSGPGVLKPMRDPDDPLASGQDDAEAKQLADYFEKKYGGPTGKKKGRKRKFDFKDYGMGYDESDPFVDNSEACDELLPNNLTTKMGGFYVNTGQLELREVSDHEGEEEEEGGSDGEDEDESSSSSSEMEDDDNDRGGDGKASKKRRRPVIHDDDDEDNEDDDDDDEDEDEEKKKSNKATVQKSSKQRPNASSSSTAALLLAKKNKRLKMQQMSKRKKFLAAAGIEGSPLKGVKKSDEKGGGGEEKGEKKKKTLTVSEMLQRKAAKDKEKSSKMAAGSDSAGAQNSGVDAPKPDGAVTGAPAAASAVTAASSLMDNVIDSVIREPFIDAPKGKSSAPPTSASSGDSGPTSPVAPPEAAVDMPADASDSLKQVVGKLKALSAASGCKGGEGKKKFFTPQVNELLLAVENECRSKTIRPGMRGRVYAHLAQHLPCNKDTLIKRARNLKTASETADMPNMIKRLQAGVDAVMPDNIAKYKAECDKAAEAKGVSANTADPAVGGEGEAGGVGGEDKSAKKIYAPRKKFLWRRDMRENFFAIVKEKLKQFFESSEGEALKSGGPAPEKVVKVEEHLKQFLTDEIKNLWPKGWMNERVLMKESAGLITDCLKEHGIFQGGDVVETIPMEQKLGKQELAQTKLDQVPGVTISTKKENSNVSINLCATVRPNTIMGVKKDVDKAVTKKDCNQSTTKAGNDVGIDLTKPSSKNSDAEKAVQESLEFALQQSLIQSHSARQQQPSVTTVRTSPPQPNAPNIHFKQQVLGNADTSTASNSLPSLSAKSHAQVPGKGMIQAEQLRQQQQQISQAVNSITSAIGMGLPVLTQQQQALAQQQLEKLLNMPSSLPQMNLLQSKSTAVVTNSTAAISTERQPASSTGQSKSTLPPSTLTMTRTPTITAAKTCPNSVPASVAQTGSSTQPKAHCLPPGRANLPTVPLIQPTLTSKASSPHSFSQSTANGLATNAAVNQPRYLQPAHQTPQPLQSRVSPSSSNIQVSVASTSANKVVSSTSPKSMSHGVTMNISPQKSPQSTSHASHPPSLGAQLSPHHQPIPPFYHTSRTPSPQKSQSAPLIPASHAGFLSQQVAQALTPPFGVFTSIGSSSVRSTLGPPASTAISMGSVSCVGNSFSLPNAIDALTPAQPISHPSASFGSAIASTSEVNGVYKPLTANGSGVVSTARVGGISIGSNAPLNLHKSPVTTQAGNQPKQAKQASPTQPLSSQIVQQLNSQQQKQQLLQPGLQLPQQQLAKQYPVNPPNSGHQSYTQQSQNDAANLSSPGPSQQKQIPPQASLNAQSSSMQGKHANATNQQLLQMAQQQVLGQNKGMNQQSLLQIQAATAVQQQQMLQQQQLLHQQQQTQLGQFKPH